MTDREDQSGQSTEGLAFRNPVDALGFGLVHHILTLDQEISDGAYRLYALLLKYARDTAGCWPGRKRLAKDLGKSVPTVERRLAELVKRGLITRQQRLNQTAMTWIEDPRDVYADAVPIKNDGDEAAGPVPIKNEGDEAAGPVPIRNEGDVPIKNDGDMSPSKMMGKQHAEGETNIMHDGDVVSKHEKQQSIAALRSFGVAKAVAERLANRCRLKDTLGWIIYARRADGLRNPTGFVVSRLRDEVPIPEEVEEELGLVMAWVGDGVPVSNVLSELDEEMEKVERERTSRRYVEGKYAEYIKH